MMLMLTDNQEKDDQEKEIDSRLYTKLKFIVAGIIIIVTGGFLWVINHNDDIEVIRLCVICFGIFYGIYLTFSWHVNRKYQYRPINNTLKLVEFADTLMFIMLVCMYINTLLKIIGMGL